VSPSYLYVTGSSLVWSKFYRDRGKFPPPLCFYPFSTFPHAPYTSRSSILALDTVCILLGISETGQAREAMTPTFPLPPLYESPVLMARERSLCAEHCQRSPLPRTDERPITLRMTLMRTDPFLPDNCLCVHHRLPSSQLPLPHCFSLGVRHAIPPLGGSTNATLRTNCGIPASVHVRYQRESPLARNRLSGQAAPLLRPRAVMTACEGLPPFASDLHEPSGRVPPRRGSFAFEAPLSPLWRASGTHHRHR